jgi:hypothetical protein
MPTSGGRVTGQTAGENEPCGAGRGRAAAAVALAGGSGFELPGLGGESHEDERPGGFGEFEERVSVGARGEEQIAGEFGAVLGSEPDGLSATELPAGLGQVGGWEGGEGLAGGQAGDQQVEEESGGVGMRSRGKGCHGHWRRGDV